MLIAHHDRLCPICAVPLAIYGSRCDGVWIPIYFAVSYVI